MISNPHASATVTESGIVAFFPFAGNGFSNATCTNFTMPPVVRLTAVVLCASTVRCVDPVARITDDGIIPAYATNANVSLPAGTVALSLHVSALVAVPPEQYFSFVVSLKKNFAGFLLPAVVTVMPIPDVAGDKSAGPRADVGCAGTTTVIAAVPVDAASKPKS